MKKLYSAFLVLFAVILLVSCATTSKPEDPMKAFLKTYSYRYPADSYPVSSDGYRYADYIPSPSKERTDFPQLTDAEFANFRKVETTGMGDNLFRGSSPINQYLGEQRANMADSLITEAGIKVIINFGNSKEKAESYPSYASSNYSNDSFEKVYLGTKWMDDKTTFTKWYPSSESKAFTESMATVMKTIAQKDGPYYIHCTWGRDRTGISCAVLEALMGATWEEIRDDFMKSYENFFGIVKGSTEWNNLVRYQIQLQLSMLFNEPDLANSDLVAHAETYIRSLGLSDGEIASMKAHLGN